MAETTSATPLSQTPDRRASLTSHASSLSPPPEDLDLTEPSLLHDHAPTIAALIAFRIRFAELELMHGATDMGPQDLERGLMVAEGEAGYVAVFDFFLRLAALVLNRKILIEPGKHKRALCDLIQLLVRERYIMPGLPNVSTTRDHETSWGDWPLESRVEIIKGCMDAALQISKDVRAAIELELKSGGPRNSIRTTQKAPKEKEDFGDGGVRDLGKDTSKTRYWLVAGTTPYTPFRIYLEHPTSSTTSSWTPGASSLSTLRTLISTVNSGSLRANFLSGTSTLVRNLEAVVGVYEKVEEEREARRARDQKRTEKVERQRKMLENFMGGGGSAYSTRTRGRRINYAELDKDSDDEKDDKTHKEPEAEAEAETETEAEGGAKVEGPVVDEIKPPSRAERAAARMGISVEEYEALQAQKRDDPEAILYEKEKTPGVNGAEGEGQCRDEAKVEERTDVLMPRDADAEEGEVEVDVTGDDVIMGEGMSTGEQKAQEETPAVVAPPAAAVDVTTA
ncbi:hypothetical protein SAICODRAFT_128872 [Saitoella complicata NRRL Y-17804]|uniref:WHIM1 domain-containing protein n=1 Tax=Saitoella complicata (strain BCRC 22490 / CBS 7301 / JCM 7358 / NBRC 10748 / NRRL Y-17804) TaxID=698492 RepID=A0A0E9NLG9_SAICN|nr:uncharacterized protein SAICODRAFT_128872 [Saitoella complicata NRRL Y-17804]ODQ52442.1 hypothetical protein SAICODRAFT_128872 [Saitoella complicata NRRL Y-17804]GAO50521.1 hypothetical protein G7K_4645-t1 [Saitoella complicata NRRL Y-17804]